jgi:RNA 2',3'-cyclic 3'-phosphodiesterase
MRTFISFNLDEDLKNKISEVQLQIKKKQNPSSMEFIKWENKNKFHLTVFFLGETDQFMLNSLISELDSFSKSNSFGEIAFESGGINCFPNFKFPRVLIIDLINKDSKVREFYNNLSPLLKNLGFESDKKFHPHLTLARIKNNFKPDFHNINEEIKFSFKFTIDKFHLMESKLLPTGSVYRILKSFTL